MPQTNRFDRKFRQLKSHAQLDFKERFLSRSLLRNDAKNELSFRAQREILLLLYPTSWRIRYFPKILNIILQVRAELRAHNKIGPKRKLFVLATHALHCASFAQGRGEERLRFVREHPLDK